HPAAGDLGAELDNHHLCRHARRAGQPNTDNADPDLQARLRERGLQPGCGAFRHVLRRRDRRGVRLHQGAGRPAGSVAMTDVAVAPSTAPALRLKRTGLALPLIVLGAVLLVVVCLFPFVWMGLSSIKTLPELYTVPPHWWPDAPTLGNYAKVLFDSNIPR